MKQWISILTAGVLGGLVVVGGNQIMQNDQEVLAPQPEMKVTSVADYQYGTNCACIICDCSRKVNSRSCTYYGARE